MTENEIKELLELLKASGMEAMLCDTPIGLVDNPVVCGDPRDMGDYTVGDVLVPRALVGIHPEFMVPVVGDSMIGAGYEEGDLLHVRMGVQPYDGDNVLACIGNDCTVKTLLHDEQGLTWLVPQNNDYDAILLNEKKDAIRIVGVVVGVEKRQPRAPLAKSLKKVHETKRKMEAARKMEDWQVDLAIKNISPMVVHARQWYAVYRQMVDRSVTDEGAYEAFCCRVASIVPDHGHLPTARELQRMAVQSFARPVPLWNEKNAPVKDKRFQDYIDIAKAMGNLLADQNLGLAPDGLPF